MFNRIKLYFKYLSIKRSYPHRNPGRKLWMNFEQWCRCRDSAIAFYKDKGEILTMNSLKKLKKEIEQRKVEFETKRNNTIISIGQISMLLEELLLRGYAVDGRDLANMLENKMTEWAMENSK